MTGLGTRAAGSCHSSRIPLSPMPKTRGHSWRFKARFRRHAFGWKSQPAIARLQEAVSEITRVARIDPILGAEGAVGLLERLSPALENVDSSSGAIGTAVNHAIAELVPVIVAAPADRGNAGRLARTALRRSQRGPDSVPRAPRRLLGRALWHDGGCLGLGRPADQHHPSGTLTRQERPWLLPRHLGVPERPLRGGAP